MGTRPVRVHLHGGQGKQSRHQVREVTFYNGIYCMASYHGVFTVWDCVWFTFTFDLGKMSSPLWTEQ